MKTIKKSASLILALALLLTAIPFAVSAATLTWPTLQSGSSGANVYALQYLLNYWGYGPTTLALDGSFGTNTTNAVKNFQTKKAPPSDGVVGSVTWTALTNISQSTSSYSDNPTKAIQYLLKNKYSMSAVDVDGSFGSTTKDAVTAFQKKMGITQDGVVGPNTWNNLISASAQVVSPLTYTISYNANGGSGAPASQTKTSGFTLTLSSTKPTMTNYTFLGWATSSTAASATYQAGGSYTANAAATLYAVWQSNSTSSKPYANWTRQQKIDHIRSGKDYSTQAKAEQQLTTVTVNIWTYPNNDTSKAKVSATRNVRINKAISADFVNIMQEVYNLPEKFPIYYYSGGGYYQVEGFSYRAVTGGTSLSYHAYGAAVDLNAEYNPYSSNASYVPSNSVYKITTNVANIFKAHGWSWGGNFSSCSDWMHFSFGE